MRPRIVWLIAMRDWRLILGGKGWYRLPLLALVMLLPIATIPSEAPKTKRKPGIQTPREPRVSGVVPPGSGLVYDPRSRTQVVSVDPIGVAGPLTAPVRRTLDALPGKRVKRTNEIRRRGKIKARPLVVLLLCISLLTGPMSESVPGERSERTLEVMLSAAITRLELVTGKWLAWTVAAGFGGAGTIATGLATGAVTPGGWLLGIPLGVGTVVALALWLVRHATDVVGGATVPMRVLPVVAVFFGGIAFWLLGYHWTLGAMVPMGGAILISAGTMTGVGPLLVTLASHTVVIGLLLVGAARGVGDLDPPASVTRGTLTQLVAPTVLWWIAVGGGGVWAMAGRTLEGASLASGVWAGGGMLLAMGLVLVARARAFPHSASEVAHPRWPLFMAPVLGGLLTLGPLAPLPGGSILDPVMARLLAAQLATGLGGLVALLGQELVFRRFIQRRFGLWGSVIAWTITVFPADPLGGLVSGVALGWLAQKGGFTASLVARLVAWAIMSFALIA